MSSYVDKDHIRYFDFVVPAAITLAAKGDCGGFKGRENTANKMVYRDYYRETGVWSAACRMPQQVHGKRIRIVSSRNSGTSFPRTDGLITADISVSLAITVADCLPIYIAVPTRNIIALLHSGRKSTGILLRALHILHRRYGVTSGDIHLLFGPAISTCCYEIGIDIAQHYRKHWGEKSVVMRDGMYYLDMVGVNMRIAHEFGIHQVDTVDECTCCTHVYHSYRRQGAASYQRMLAMISQEDR